MKATFNDFLTEHPSCSRFENINDAELLFNLLSEDDAIFAMIDAAELGRPSLEPCIKMIEDWYDALPRHQIDLTDDFTRKAIGRMVKTIIAPFGYDVCGRKAIAKQTGLRFFKTASCYGKTRSARLKVIRKIVEA